MCEFINVNQLQGRVFAYYNWGGYIHLCTAGRLKVFIDGRADQLYADDTFREYLKVLQQAPGWQGVIERSGAEYALWPTRNSRVGSSLAKSENWRVVYQDLVSILLARKDVELPAALKQSPDSPHRDANLALRELQQGRMSEALSLFRQALSKDPHFMPACIGLARTLALAGEFAEAHTTVERCNRIMPDQKQAEVLHAFVDAARAKAERQPGS
jgi:tetratricopeptide (TPR) repeat protein